MNFVLPGKTLKSTTFRFLRSFALYFLIVIGGLTLFLILAPLFGYLPYSDRPGPGWIGAFPALSWHAFWNNTLEMLGLCLVLVKLFALPVALLAAMILLFERVCHRRDIVRLVGGAVGGVMAGYMILGITWYIAAGLVFLLFAILLGTIAGATVL